MSKIRTRFAPSPTGTPESIHLGFIIRALWNYAYAKKNNGHFILRIEDTDQKRSRKDTEEEIYKVLKKFGIQWDEGPDIGGPHGPYRQSERLEKYKEAAEKLVAKGYAYYDFDAIQREKEEIKSSYDDKEKLKELKIRPKARNNSLEESLKRVENGEPYVIRVKIPEDKIFEYEDWVLKKKIKFFGKEVPDMILLKSDGFPTYHLAVVVDDIDMQISHVFRGQEWISSTPIHLYLYEGLESKVPEIGHFTVIIDPRTGKKFSKRDMTAFFGVNTWLNKKYSPEAILNYLMLLGWAPKDNRELFTLDEFVQAFDQDGVQKSNPTFNKEKLDWFNNYYYQKEFPEDASKGALDDDIFETNYISIDKIAKKYPFAANFSNFVSGASVYRNEPNFLGTAAGTAVFMPSRMSNINDYDNTVDFLFTEPTVDKSLLGINAVNHIKAAIDAVENVTTWSLENISVNFMEKIKENNFKTGDFFMDLRIAITGKKFTPPINESIVILGKQKTLNRLKNII